MTSAAAPLSYDEYRALRHFDGLNGVRCLAILAVVWHHSYVGDRLALSRGFLGVDLFFVLSGFLITTLLLRERDATGTIALGRFWLRRCFRLMPPLYLMLGMLALYYAAHRGAPASTAYFDALPANALYLSNWVRGDAHGLAGLWSLATEEQFYLIWPLVERFGGLLIWPLLLLAMLANQAMNFGWLDPALGRLLAQPVSHYEIVDATYMPICLGVAAARLLHVRASFAVARAVLGTGAAPWLLALALLLLDLRMPGDISGWPRLIVQLVMALLILSLVLRPAGAAVRLLEWRPLVHIGGISYGLYLYHMWANHAAWALTNRLGADPDLLVFPATLLIGLAVAEISYRVLEAPLLRFARRYRPQRGAISGATDGNPS